MSALQDDIQARAREIKTDGYPMSIGEVLSLYKDGDIEIHPEFQRIYRWTDDQKSRLVESILLGIPIPSIFVSQRDDGVWDVVDGVQRLSTIFEFAGVYKDEDGVLQPPLRLLPTEYLPSLKDHRYEAQEGATFDDTLRRDFKRSKLDFKIVKKESDPQSKYDLFQRLNSGTDLSPQEARNCLLVMIDAEFFRWMLTLSEVPSFQSCVAISDRKEDEGFRQELVLRFLLQARFGDATTELSSELSDFVTNRVRELATDQTFDREAYAVTFREVFDLLDKTLGDQTFRRWDGTKGRFLGAFSISSFEAVTAGLARHIEKWNTTDDAETRLTESIKAMWGDSGFRDNSGTGITARRRLPRLVQFGREHFKVG